jgi:hypothetical protein
VWLWIKYCPKEEFCKMVEAFSLLFASTNFMCNPLVAL